MTALAMFPLLPVEKGENLAVMYVSALNHARWFDCTRMVWLVLMVIVDNHSSGGAVLLLLLGGAALWKIQQDPSPSSMRARKFILAEVGLHSAQASRAGYAIADYRFL